MSKLVNYVKVSYKSSRVSIFLLSLRQLCNV